MRFLLLLYDDAAAIDALPPAERRALVDEHIAFSRTLRARGAFVYGDPLDAPETARTVRLATGGESITTDGPFLEAKEALGGFYVVEASDGAEAEAIAREVPRSPGLVVEVRPIPDV
jgi:hypothetical protein